MTNHFSLSDELRPIFEQYFESFSKKEYIEENNDYDVLMEVFGITPELKRENRQYWGRELGMVWEKTLELIAKHHNDYLPRFRIDRDEPVDFLLGADAIDTKYRIGSGDAGTLKSFGNTLHRSNSWGTTQCYSFSAPIICQLQLARAETADGTCSRARTRLTISATGWASISNQSSASTEIRSI